MALALASSQTSSKNFVERSFPKEIPFSSKIFKTNLNLFSYLVMPPVKACSGSTFKKQANAITENIKSPISSATLWCLSCCKRASFTSWISE
ncbi:MAG: hypothetical protein BGO76_02920 [Caedibacter sp. 38-128]|nr:MAG: hypothetical protein BGO76_02920 [Caedibacter sp. 38-128]